MIGSDTLSLIANSDGSYSAFDQYVPWVAHVDPHPYPQPVDDCQQDWTLISSLASTDSNLMCHSLKRLLNTQDEFDRQIGNTFQNIVWAVIGTGKDKGHYAYHGSENRGVGVLNFFDAPKTYDWSGHQYFDIKFSSYQLTSEKTQQVCQWQDLVTLSGLDFDNNEYYFTGFDHLPDLVLPDNDNNQS